MRKEAYYKLLDSRLNGLPYWYEKIITNKKYLKDLNIPETIYVKFNPDDMNEFVYDICNNSNPNKSIHLLKEKYMKTIEIIANKVGYPFFMRTDMYSAKEQYKDTCFVDRPNKLLNNLHRLLQSSIMANGVGIEAHHICLRKFVKGWKIFELNNGMPIGIERRYFIKDGKVVCHHPRWNFDDFKGDIHEIITDKMQLEKINIINSESNDEINILSNLSEHVYQCVEDDHKYWAIDYMKDYYGKWWLIDMSIGETTKDECRADLVFEADENEIYLRNCIGKTKIIK